MQYKHLFFDLDHTLWDFHSNQILTLRELFISYQLNRFFRDFDEFFEKYMAVLAYRFALSQDISMRPMAMYRKFSPVAEDYQFRLETGFKDLVFLELGYGNDVNVIAGLGFAFGGFRIGYYYSSLNTYLSNVASGSNSIWLRYQLFDPLKTEIAEEK